MAASVTGRYFVDSNRNFLKDGTEPGVSGATVYLMSGDAVIATTTTNGTGNYAFNNVRPGQYHVEFGSSQYGLNFTKSNYGSSEAHDSDVWGTDGGKGVSSAFYVGNNQAVTNIDAGVVSSSSATQTASSGSGSVSGRYFRDANNNALEDGADSGVAGATVRLLKNGVAVASTTTNSNGNYTFRNIDDGNYAVEFLSISSAYDFARSNYGSNNYVDSDVWRTTSYKSGVSENVVIQNGTAVNNIDAGISNGSTTATPTPTPLVSAPQTSSLAGRYFLDKNLSKLEDSGDTGVAGASVRLVKDGSVVATTTTNANGDYIFNNIEPGAYTVEFPRVSSIANFIKGNYGGSANEDIHSDVWATQSNGTGTTGLVYVGTGQAVRNVDAGVAIPTTATTPTPTPVVADDAAISGRYFKDNNNSNTEDGSDSGLGGRLITLIDEDGASIATTTTNSGGYYSFSGLEAGDYRIKFAGVDGHGFVKSNVGGTAGDATDSDVWSTQTDGSGSTGWIQVGQSQKVTNVDAGVTIPVTSSAPTTVAPSPTSAPQTDDALNVLFIGNSYTYYAPRGNYDYNVSAQFEKMAQVAGYDISFDGSFIGGVTLATHWGKTGSTSAREMIANNDYDLVVIQDATWNAGAVNQYATLFTNHAENYGSEVLITSQWAGDWVTSISGGDQWANAVDYANENAALNNDIAYSPVGRAYEEAHKQLSAKYGNGDDGQTAENMLTEDAIHASELGAYLAANVIYNTAFGERAPTASEYIPPYVSAADATMLQDIAWNAYVQYGIGSDGDWLS